MLNKQNKATLLLKSWNLKVKLRIPDEGKIAKEILLHHMSKTKSVIYFNAVLSELKQILIDPNCVKSDLNAIVCTFEIAGGKRFFCSPHETKG